MIYFLDFSRSSNLLTFCHSLNIAMWAVTPCDVLDIQLCGL
jgi:hypothetical protein